MSKRKNLISKLLDCILPKPSKADPILKLSGTDKYKDADSLTYKVEPEYIRDKKVITITTDKGQTVWMTPKFKRQMDELQDEFDKHVSDYLLYGIPLPKREPKEDDNVKLAYVYVGTERRMVGLDNKTMKAYKLRDDCPMWKLPLEEIEYTSFERWCTGFDV